MNKKGFTLAELLVVVAIIAVLVAVSIPVFGTQLNKARIAVDEANIRTGYSQVCADAITNTSRAVDVGTGEAKAIYYLKDDGSVALMPAKNGRPLGQGGCNKGEPGVYQCKSTVTNGKLISGLLSIWDSDNRMPQPNPGWNKGDAIYYRVSYDKEGGISKVVIGHQW